MGAPMKAAVFYITQDFPETGRTAYYYLQARMGMEKKLLAMMEGAEPFDLASFGTVLASGYGAPPETLRREMQERYHIH